MIYYYEGEGDKKMLPEIYYLAGSTYFDLHDSPQALDYYHKVLDNITADEHLRLWGITHAQIGYVMFYQGNYAAAIDHYKISYRVDSLRNDVEGMILICEIWAILIQVQKNWIVRFFIVIKLCNWH